MIRYFKTREWKHPEGYKFLAAWTNAVLLRFLIRKFTATLPRSEYRRKNQLDDAGRSTVANIEEGFKRPTTKEYLDFLGFSEASLEEVKGDIKRALQDGFLKSKPKSRLADLGIDLKEIQGILRDSKGEIPLNFLYSPLRSLKRSDLTYEIFLELINKTGYLLRQLVSSLEKKITKDVPISFKEKLFKARLVEQLEERRKFDEELKQIVAQARKKDH